MAVKDYTVILDQFGYIDADTKKPTYANRGETVQLDDETAKRALDRDIHYPTGAVAETGTLLAQALATRIPADVDPNVARSQIAALVQAQYDPENAAFPFLDPAHRPNDHVRTGGGSFDYKDLSEDDLKALAAVRGVDGKGLDHETLANAVALAGLPQAVAPSLLSGTPSEDETYSPQADVEKKSATRKAASAKDAKEAAEPSSTKHDDK